MVLYLHKVAKMLGLEPKQLKQHIRNGELHLDDAGMVDCDEIKILYPREWEQAQTDPQIEYLAAVKATCGNWKNGAREQMEKVEKHHLVQTIRRLEAENYELKKQVADKEQQLKLIEKAVAEWRAK
jgi:hypothetical protein